MLTWIKRIVIGLAAVIGVIIVFLIGSVLVDMAAGADRLDAVTNTRIPGAGGGPEVRAFVAQPPGDGPFPAVIMIHEFYGLNESITGKASGLAQEGYVVVAPDTFRGSTTAWIPRAIFQVIRTPAEQINQDLDSIYAWLESQPQVDARRIGVMGFCYGGRASLTYSLHNNRLAATAIFYGSLDTDAQTLSALPGPVLGIFGGADASIPVSEVRAFEAALNQAGIPNEITIYEGQPHAFVSDIDSIRAGGVQGQAWAQLLAFLDRSLKQGSGSAPEGEPAAYRQPFDWRYYLMLAYEHALGSASQAH